MPYRLARLNALRAQVVAAIARGDKYPLEVEVIIWPMTKEDVGHSALRIGDLVLGYYPTDVDNNGHYDKSDLDGSPGVLKVHTIAEAEENYAGQRIDVYSLEADATKLLCLIDFYITLLSGPGTYALLSRNCTTIVADALAHCCFDLAWRLTIAHDQLRAAALYGKVTIKETHTFSLDVEIDHKGVVSPADLALRLSGRPYVKGVTQEVVGQ